MLTYQQERFGDIEREVEPLLVRHWDEIALNKDKIALDVDRAAYRRLDAAGTLAIFTARDAGSRLVGYVAFFVGPHPHYKSTVFASYDLFWLAPECRQGLAGYRLFKFAETRLIARGVQAIKLGEKLHFQAGRLGKLFERLGYAPIETIYSKYVGD